MFFFEHSEKLGRVIFQIFFRGRRHLVEGLVITKTYMYHRPLIQGNLTSTKTKPIFECKGTRWKKKLTQNDNIGYIWIKLLYILILYINWREQIKFPLQEMRLHVCCSLMKARLRVSISLKSIFSPIKVCIFFLFLKARLARSKNNTLTLHRALPLGIQTSARPTVLQILTKRLWSVGFTNNILLP